MTVVSQKNHKTIPSGSGIAIHNNTVYIIGDDATNIYCIDLNSGKQTKIPITGRDATIYREAKPVKHDFESAVIIRLNSIDYMMAIGSGSKKVMRDSMMLLNITNPADCRIFSLTQLYDYLRTKTNTPIEQWNIEGATVATGNLILANRGTNTLISIDLNDFLLWIQNPTDNYPTLSIYSLKLPSIQNKEARLSGLCTLNDSELIFCASVEDTPNWITDGPVLGSYIGTYSLKQKAVTSVHLLQDKSGKPVIEKLESLDILDSKNPNAIDIIAIADNDDGSSRIFNIQLIGQAR